MQLSEDHEYHTQILRYRRLKINVLILIAFLAMVVIARNVWAWQMQREKIAAYQAAAIQFPDLHKAASEAADKAALKLPDEMDAALQLVNLYRQWPIVEDDNTVIQTEWGMYAGENLKNDFTRQMELSRGAPFTDPVENEAAYVDECMKLVDEMLAVFRLPGQYAMNISTSEMRELARLLSDLSWRLTRQTHRATTRELKMVRFRQLIKTLTIMSKCPRFCLFRSKPSPMISAHTYIGLKSIYHRSITRRLSKVHPECLKSQDFVNYARKCIHQLHEPCPVEAKMKMQYYWQLSQYLNDDEGVNDLMTDEDIVRKVLVGQPLADMSYTNAINWQRQLLADWQQGVFPLERFMANQQDAANEYDEYHKYDEDDWMIDPNPLGLNLTGDFSAQFLLQYRFWRVVARTYLALKLYELKNDQFPEKLDALIPTFLSRLPIDAYSREKKPLIYLPKKKLLYSIGENGIDDGGIAEDREDIVLSLDGKAS